MQFKSIVFGSLKSRATDKYGSGQFHAGRSMGGNRYSHQGLDIAVQPKDRIFSPVEGNVVREAIPYPPFSGVLIRGTGQYAGYEVKLFYVNGLACGAVSAGDYIGNAQDLTIKYPGITNHVHMEVRKNGE